MTKSRGILPPRKVWSDAELRSLARLYPDHTAADIADRLGVPVALVHRKAHSLGLAKSDAFKRSAASGRLQPGAGADTRFKKGQVPANKGLRRPGWAPGRMAENQFRKGERSGVAVKRYQPIGAERTSKDGYLERKVNDDLPSQRRWRAVHIIVWEEAHGPLPKGHCLAFIDHDKTHIALDNLELITRAERMRRNTIHRYPPELKQTIRLAGKLKRTIEGLHEKQD